MLSCFYHPTSLACRYFEPHVALDNRSKLPPDPNPKWTEAENAFQQKEFELAITLYVSLIQETDPSMSYEAQWNILLAQLALTGPTPNWKLALHSFLEAAPEHLRTQAEKLFRMLDSPVYKFLFAHIHGNISVIKPRFI
jgi:hypothetical protein